MANVYSITFAIICIVGGCLALLLLSTNAPQSVTSRITTHAAEPNPTEVLPVTPAVPEKSVVLRTINIGNGSMMIEGRRFINLPHAESQGLQITGGGGNQGRGGISTPGLDFDRKMLLESGITAESGLLSLRQIASVGDYQWWLWLADPNGVDHERIRVQCGAQEFRLDATQSRGQFGRFGPFPATANTAGLTCEIRGLARARLAACEIWSTAKPAPQLPMHLRISWPEKSPIAGEGVLLRCTVIGGLPGNGEVRLLVNGQAVANATQEPYDLRTPPIPTGEVEILVEVVRDGVTLVQEKGRKFTIQDTSGGGLLLENWRETSGSVFAPKLLTLMATTPPDHTGPVQVSAVDPSLGQQHLTRLRGYLHAPATGDYVFLLYGRGGCEVRLGEDASTKSPRLLAALSADETRMTEADTPWRSAPVRLVAGLRYALELRHKNGAGLAGMTLGWVLPDGQTELPIANARLSPAAQTEAAFEAR